MLLRGTRTDEIDPVHCPVFQRRAKTCFRGTRQQAFHRLHANRIYPTFRPCILPAYAVHFSTDYQACPSGPRPRHRFHYESKSWPDKSGPTRLILALRWFNHLVSATERDGRCMKTVVNQPFCYVFYGNSGFFLTPSEIEDTFVGDPSFIPLIEHVEGAFQCPRYVICKIAIFGAVTIASPINFKYAHGRVIPTHCSNVCSTGPMPFGPPVEMTVQARKGLSAQLLQWGPYQALPLRAVYKRFYADLNDIRPCQGQRGDRDQPRRSYWPRPYKPVHRRRIWCPHRFDVPFKYAVRGGIRHHEAKYRRGQRFSRRSSRSILPFSSRPHTTCIPADGAKLG